MTSSTAEHETSQHTGDAPGKVRVIITRVIIASFLVSAITLFCLLVYATLQTNVIVLKMKDFAPGTPLAVVVEAYGPPDRVDQVDGIFKWGRRLRHVSETVKSVAIYTRNTSPQVCTYLLDKDDRIIEIEVFASY